MNDAAATGNVLAGCGSPEPACDDAAAAVAVRAGAAPEPDAPASQRPHVHSDDCGHIAIEHACEISGQTNIGFLQDDGRLQCMTLEGGEPLPCDPSSLCFEQECVQNDEAIVTEPCCSETRPHYHAHIKTECGRGVRGAALQRNAITIFLQGDQACNPNVPTALLRKCTHDDANGHGHGHVRPAPRRAPLAWLTQPPPTL